MPSCCRCYSRCFQGTKLQGKLHNYHRVRGDDCNVLCQFPTNWGIEIALENWIVIDQSAKKKLCIAKHSIAMVLILHTSQFGVLVPDFIDETFGDRGRFLGGGDNFGATVLS